MQRRWLLRNGTGAQAEQALTYEIEAVEGEGDSPKQRKSAVQLYEHLVEEGRQRRVHQHVRDDVC